MSIGSCQLSMKGKPMKDYDKNFNSADYDRNRYRKKALERLGRTRKIKQKRKKSANKWFSNYYLNNYYEEKEPIYVYKTVPEHVETRTVTYYDPYAVDYGFDENKNRVVKKRGREVTKVTRITVPEKKVKRIIGYNTTTRPVYVKRRYTSGLKKFIKNLAKRKVRHAGNDDTTITSTKRSGHKRVYDHWLDD